MSSLYIVYYEFLMNKIGVFILYQSYHLCYDISCIALVAQLDRAAGFYPAGRGFDSPSTHVHRFTTIVGRAVFLQLKPLVRKVFWLLRVISSFRCFSLFFEPSATKWLHKNQQIICWFFYYIYFFKTKLTYLLVWFLFYSYHQLCK